MEKEIELAKNILVIMEDAKYHDLYENIYDELKFLKLSIINGKNVSNNLKDLLYVLNDDKCYIDLNGKCKDVKNLLKNWFENKENNFSIS